MSDKIAKAIRKEANQVAEKTLDRVAPAFTALVSNQELLRKRVVQLEAVLQGSLLDRLVWLFTGRIRSEKIMAGEQKVADVTKNVLTAADDNSTMAAVGSN